MLISLTIGDMGLSPAEEHGIIGLLKMIPSYDLIAFVATITNGLVKTDNPNGEFKLGKMILI